MLVAVLKHALMITSFVLIMMLLIEYINVQTKGIWLQGIKHSRFSQYFLGAFLGATPGCLGAFTVVSLYSHRTVSFGALVAAMIATSGDEAFVMLAMFPIQALWIAAIMLIVAIFAGWITDKIFVHQARFLEQENHDLELHQEESCRCFVPQNILPQLKQMTLYRALLILLLGGFLALLMIGVLAPISWDWKKITFTIGASFALFVILTVPDHFLKHHLWMHIIKQHLPRIFMWTFGVLLAFHFLDSYLDVEALIKDNIFIVLLIAVLVGLIPESGPHLIFVTLFAQGAIPISILLANSIVQDGHGTLPLLAVSGRAFIMLKIVNMAFGLLLGFVGLYFIT
jgi:hypothetical protein